VHTVEVEYDEIAHDASSCSGSSADVRCMFLIKIPAGSTISVVAQSGPSNPQHAGKRPVASRAVGPGGAVTIDRGAAAANHARQYGVSCVTTYFVSA